MPYTTLRVLGYNTGTGAGDKDAISFSLFEIYATFCEADIDERQQMQISIKKM